MRKREIALALALGAMGAGGAALVIEANRDDYQREERAIQEERETTFALTDFDEISIIGPQNVIITQGDKYVVSASGEPDTLRQMEAVVEDGVLILRPRDQGISSRWGDFDGLTVMVSLPDIKRISLAGSGEVSVDRITGESFEAMLGGSGRLTIGQLQVDRALFSISGSGDLDASGAARDVTVNIGGSGEVHAGGLIGNRTVVAIAGSGEVQLTALEEAQVSITGSGDVDISGPATCSVTRTGSGDVRCEGGGGDDKP